MTIDFPDHFLYSMVMGKFFVLLYLLICPLHLSTVYAADHVSSAGLSSSSASASAEETVKVITGRVTDRQEIWDRRTNPLMGRPDWLKEIILTVEPEAAPAVTVSIKGSELIIRYKMIMPGNAGVFTVTGSEMPYRLVSFEPSGVQNISSMRTVKPPVSASPLVIRTAPPHDGLLESEKISGRVIIQSKDLQKKAVREISRKYKMTGAIFISMKSFSGPMPPSGGYIYWGVKGKIKGIWHVWQRGYGLRQRESLEDPQRYNKCNSPNTLILTPAGQKPISELKAGDLVMSEGKAVPLIFVTRVRAIDHKVCRIVFDDGKILEVSPGHPLADGRLVGSLRSGDQVDAKRIIRIELIPYNHFYTYDILPESGPATYTAEGIRLGTTIPR